MIYTYAADLRNLKDPKRYPDLLTGLSENKVTEILGHRNSNDRILTLGTALLFKEILSRHNISIDDSFPEMSKRSSGENIFFCFSNSKNMVICSFGSKETGCNIEKMDEMPKSLSMQYFSRKERKYLESFNEKDANFEFYRLLTLKESFLNMSGDPRLKSIKNYEIIIDEDIELYKEGQLEECWFEEYTIPGYRISVCAKENDFSELIFISVS